MSFTRRIQNPLRYSRVFRPSKPLETVIWERSLRKHEGLTIFILSFLMNFILAYFLFFVWHIGNSDALSRTANAFYVLYSRQPHLAAIGFVWPPLPSILQLPLLPVTKALECVTFTGSIVSSLFGAACLVMMNRLLANQKFPAAIRWILIGLLQIHPDTWYLFSAGMAESIFLFFVLTTLSAVNSIPRSMRSWVIAGLSLAAAFYIRYEALAMIAGVGLAVIVHLWASGTSWIVKTEGWLIAILMPPVYGVALWLFFNWTLMGDPLFFLRSVYSLSNAPDIAKIAGLTHPLYLAWGNVVEAIKMGFLRSFQQNPAYPIMGIIAFISILWHQNRKGFGLFIVMLSITAFYYLAGLFGIIG